MTQPYLALVALLRQGGRWQQVGDASALLALLLPIFKSLIALDFVLVIGVLIGTLLGRYCLLRVAIDAALFGQFELMPESHDPAWQCTVLDQQLYDAFAIAPQPERSLASRIRGSRHWFYRLLLCQMLTLSGLLALYVRHLVR